MSRIGYKPLAVPQGVKVALADGLLTVEGPKGKLTQDVKPGVEFKIAANSIEVSRTDESKQTKAYHGLYRNLLNNMVIGVSAGFTKSLLINGVGFRAEVKGTMLVLNLGYSNEFFYVIPQGITITVDGNNKVNVSGIDKQRVGQVASEIRSLRGPEPYKGKGIRYDNEHIRRKVGKSGVK